MTTAQDSTGPADSRGSGGLRQNLVIGACSVLAGAIVIPYGASMPYIREGIPGPGLFPMMIGGLLILFGVLLALTSLLARRRERRRLEELAAAGLTPAVLEGPADDALSLTGAAVPGSAEDVPAEELATVAVMDTDIGSDGARRWINGAVLMGAIVVYVLLAEVLGFPLTMAVLVTAIVWSLRAKWWVAVTTGVLTSVGLWAMFEQALMVQLPDGILRGF
ncbi:tripartite tricarboxylate transporter TctB family protein [Brachybacterium sp. AOP43-C2-M15]|uniref:tripartite tricarboxylate transporter TctB family protein n=1 Tax=Brachybacterium sp. AOP43-C2-M15 TaxID=3457661 RepID=UPI0040342224